MVSPLQIDSYTRDLWGEFDPLAIAEISPLAYDPCLRPKIIVCLDPTSQQVPALGYAQTVIRIRPESYILGFLCGSSYGGTPLYTFQAKDLELNRTLFAQPISQSLLVNTLGVNYPNLLNEPYPVVGKGRWLFEVWNQQDTAALICPLLLTLEPK